MPALLKCGLVPLVANAILDVLLPTILGTTFDLGTFCLSSLGTGPVLACPRVVNSSSHLIRQPTMAGFMAKDLCGLWPNSGGSLSQLGW
jgi:hypothetical protein